MAAQREPGIVQRCLCVCVGGGSWEGGKGTMHVYAFSSCVGDLSRKTDIESRKNSRKKEKRRMKRNRQCRKEKNEQERPREEEEQKQEKAQQTGCLIVFLPKCNVYGICCQDIGCTFSRIQCQGVYRKD